MRFEEEKYLDNDENELDIQESLDDQLELQLDTLVHRMSVTLEKAVENTQDLNELNGKTNQIKYGFEIYSMNATTVKNTEWKRKIKLYAVFLSINVMVIIGIVLIVLKVQHKI